MSDGRFADLAHVMTFYAEGQAARRGRVVGLREPTADLAPPLTAGQQTDLIAFLDTLTAAPPAALTRQPAHP